MFCSAGRWGGVWRKVLGGAPQLTQADSIVQVTNDRSRTLAMDGHPGTMRLLNWFGGPWNPADEVRRLLAKEVPEVRSGIVQIRAIGRLPGTLTKIAVASTDASIDAVGACVGAHGARIQSIVRQLGGEWIDLVPWQADAERFLRFAIAPLRIVTLSIDGARKIASVTVDRPDPAMSVPPVEAIQFAASQLTGTQLDIRLHGAA